MEENYRSPEEGLPERLEGQGPALTHIREQCLFQPDWNPLYQAPGGGPAPASVMQKKSPELNKAPIPPKSKTQEAQTAFMKLDCIPEKSSVNILRSIKATSTQ